MQSLILIIGLVLIYLAATNKLYYVTEILFTDQQKLYNPTKPKGK